MVAADVRGCGYAGAGLEACAVAVAESALSDRVAFGCAPVGGSDGGESAVEVAVSVEGGEVGRGLVDVGAFALDLFDQSFDLFSRRAGVGGEPVDFVARALREMRDL